jgi:hypothetical protein
MGKVDNPLTDEQENRTLKEYFERQRRQRPKEGNKFQAFITTFALVRKIIDERGEWH